MNAPDLQTTRLKANHFEYSGKSSKLFLIWLVNCLLMLPTLGIYRFWAKTRMRKYKINNLTLGQDPFEYSGTGKELFIGFLKIIPILIVLGLPYAMLSISNGDPMWASLYLLSLPFIFYFLHVATYASARYISNRIKWRGIRGHLKGSAMKYGLFAMWRSILNFITLGLLKPWSDVKKHEYMMNNMYFGSTKCHYKANVKGLYGPYMIMYLVFILPILAGLTIGGVLKGQELINNAKQTELKIERQYEQPFGTPNQGQTLENVAPEAGNQDDYYQYETMESEGNIDPDSLQQYMGGFAAIGFLFGFIAVIGVYMAIIIIGLLFVTPYHAALTRKKSESLKLEGLRFKSKVTTSKLLKLRIVNVLIIFLTLGLGYAAIQNRKMRFFADNTIVGGDLDAFSTEQASRAKLGHGEEFSDFLEADLGLDFGFGG